MFPACRLSLTSREIGAISDCSAVPILRFRGVCVSLYAVTLPSSSCKLVHGLLKKCLSLSVSYLSHHSGPRHILLA